MRHPVRHRRPPRPGRHRAEPDQPPDAGPDGRGPLRVPAQDGAESDDLLVVVANDTRVFTDINQLHTFMGPDWSLLGTSSRSLAQLACQIYAVYGVETCMTAPGDASAYMPTPELSFAIRDLRAAGGLNVSASHNHPDDNGLKVYTPDRRPVLPAGRREPLQDRRAGRARSRRSRSWSPGTLGAAAEIDAGVHRRYISMYTDRAAALCRSSAAVRAQAADRVHAAVRDRAGERRRDRDRRRLRAARAAATSTRTARSRPSRCARRTRRSPASPTRRSSSPTSVGAELVLSTDPDADRLGVEVRLAAGHGGT